MQWRQATTWWWFKRLAYLLVAAVLAGGLLSLVVNQAAGATTGTEAPDWVAPPAMAIKRVGPLTAVQDEGVLFSNVDCSALRYRLASGGDWQTGCFTETAAGLLDGDSNVMIFNGTDQALPLLPNTPHGILAPWPGALDLVELDHVATGGDVLSLYRNPLGVMQDYRDGGGEVIAKQLTQPPDVTLRDSVGQPLLINAETLAFSDDGSWLVAETLSGSFVRINLATLDMTAFAPAFVSWGGSSLLKSQVAVSGDGRFVAIANDNSEVLKVYDLASCQGPVVQLQPQACQSYDYRPFAEAQIGDFHYIQHLRFVNDRLLSFRASTGDLADETTNGTYELAPYATIGSLIDYLGLGDSYTSGEGAYDYLEGTDEPGNQCHLSARSYPMLLTHDLFSGIGGHSVACSGAVIDDVGSTSGEYRGQIGGPSWQQLGQTQPDLQASLLADFTPGHVAQQRFVGQYQPGVVTVSVGGNDIGFSDVIKRCVMPHLLHPSDNQCYKTYEDRLELTQLIDRTVPSWTALYRQLQLASPQTRLYVVGYPEIADATGDCAANVHLSQAELEFANELTGYLNQAIRQAADQAGVNYVDISQALVGHRLCETASYAVAVNGLTSGVEGKSPVSKLIATESYHPNALGHELIEQAILKQTHNLAGPAASGGLSGDPDPSPLLQVPKSGRSVQAVVPDDHLTSEILGPGQGNGLQASGAADGLAAHSGYAVHLDGPAGPVIATVSSDGAGDVATDISLPATTAAGGHTIDVIGVNQAGEAVDVTQPVYVPVSGGDSDGDGIDDSLDSCPASANSGQDQDRDGVDDSCDGLIGLAPSASGGSGGDSAGGGHGAPITDSEVAPNTSDSAPHESGVSIADFVMRSEPLVATDAQSVPRGQSAGKQVLGASSSKPDKTARPLLSPERSNFTRSIEIEHRLKLWPWLFLQIVAWILLGLAFWLAWLINHPSYEAAAENMRFKRTYLYQNGGLWTTIRDMNWVRKSLVALLSLLLFGSLLGGVMAFSADTTLSGPAKLEGLLKDSKLYDHFVANAIDQAQQSTSQDTGSNGFSLDDPVVQQAAQSAFPRTLIEQSVNTVLESNYAWLQGKTATPNFAIDLTAARQAFADKVGEYAATRLVGLTPCTALQEAQLPNPSDIDALAINCRPAGLTPAAASTLVTHKIVTSDNFLSKPVITPRTINPKDDKGGSQLYYQKFSRAPRAYQLGQKLPLILGVVALLSLVGIIFIAPTRRKGLRRVGVVLLTSGLLLIIGKFIANLAFTRIEKRVFNSSSVGELQQSLVDFAHHVQQQITTINLYFGLGFVVLGVACLIYAMAVRHQRHDAAPEPPAASAPTPEIAKPTNTSASARSGLRAPSAPLLDIKPPKSRPKPAGPLRAKPAPQPVRSKATPAKKTPPPRRPRLIQ